MLMQVLPGILLRSTATWAGWPTWRRRSGSEDPLDAGSTPLQSLMRESPCQDFAYCLSEQAFQSIWGVFKKVVEQIFQVHGRHLWTAEKARQHQPWDLSGWMGKRQGIQCIITIIIIIITIIIIIIIIIIISVVGWGRDKVYNASCIRCCWNTDMFILGLQFNSKASFSAN